MTRFQSVQLNNGKVLSGEVVEELVTDIVNKFSEAGLSCDEGKKSRIITYPAIPDTEDRADMELEQHSSELPATLH